MGISNFKPLLILTSDYPPYLGGIAKVIYNLAKYLTLYGLRVLVLAPKTEKAQEFDQKQEFKTKRLLFFNFLFLFFYLFFYIKKQRIKKIIVAKVYPEGFSIYLLSFFLRFDYYLFAFGNEVFYPRILEKSKKERIIFKIKRAIFRRAKKVFPISKYTKGLIKKMGLLEEKIKIIYPGVEPGEFEKVNRQRVKEIKEKYNLKNKKVILTVGRLYKRKGQDKVIEALSLVLKKIPNTVYLIVGDGPEKDNLKLKIENLKLKDKVIFAGAPKDDALPYFYSLCEVFIMTSRCIEKETETEGFGIVYLEAGACQKPTIGSNEGGIPEAVLEQKTGLLINDPNDEKEIASFLIKLLTNQKLAEKLGEAGRKRVEKELNWKVQVAKLKSEIFND